MGFKKESMKKFFSFFLVMLMSVTSVSAVPVKAVVSKSSQQEKAFTGNGYEITFKVMEQYSDSFNANVVIKNTSDVSIDNWVVEFAMPNKITKIWNGAVKSNNGGTCIIKNTGSNQDIKPGRSVSFSFKAIYNGKVQIPQKYNLLNFEEEVSAERYEIKVTNNSIGIFNREIRIKNISGETIEDWKLQFNSNANIKSFKAASILKHSGTHYYIKNAGYNSNIKPGQTVVIGFSENPANLKTEPANYVLSEIVQKPSVVDSSKDSDKDGLADVYEEYFRTNPMEADTDGDGINDYTEILLRLNPLSKDSDKNGKNDGLEDADGDGLSNLDEINAGTNCAKKDTDGDGLSDGKEVRVYHTSPILKDTDGDSIDDGDEINLGLKPLKKYSNGVTNDNKRKIQQSLSAKKIADSLKDSTNLLVPSLSGAVPDVMDKEVSLDKCDNYVLLKNHAVMGKPIQVNTSLKTDNGLKLSFNYSKFITYYDESSVKVLTICQFADHKFIPLKTRVDNKNQCIYANISGKGIYFVLNIEKFLNSLGINPLNKVNAYANPHSAAKNIKAVTTVTEDVTTTGETVTNGTGVLLSDYQYVQLNGEVSPANGIDTDGDGVSDYTELGTAYQEDLTPDVQQLLEAYGVPSDYYSGKTSITLYDYVSNPVLPDTDYDGKNDNIDEYPFDNSFSGVLHTSYANSNVSYIMDYTDFFRSNSSYSQNMGTISSLYSAVVYSGNTFDGMNLKSYMQDNGLYDVHDYNLSGQYSDSDVSEAYIGHRKVSFDGETKEIIAIIVRGTNGTLNEWTSNFDIGTTDEYWDINDWIVENNHKGFDVAATRILRCLDEYESSGYVDQSVPSVYWVMGHSRGAGIANIIGARLDDQSKYVYAYTFAAPNTTTASDADSYEGIYNILNTDDFVPYLPMAAWGFTHYGKSVSISIADNYETEWEDLTGCKNEFGVVDYNWDAIGMGDTLQTLSDLVNDRNQCYIFTCSCHGDGSMDNITIRNYGTSLASRESAIAKIPYNALPYCAITRYNGFLFVGWDFTVCQQPEYFMQLLAAFMSGNISAYRFTVELNIADRYEAAKSAIISSGLGGLANPHYTESYYLLSTHVDSSSF